MKREKKKSAPTTESTEIFEVEKGGKEKIITKKVHEEEKAPSKEQLKKESRLFVNLFLVLAGFIIIFAVTYWIIYSSNHFEVEGVKFVVDTQTLRDKPLYKTTLPINYNGTAATYNLYFRKDPRELINIPFDGEINLNKNLKDMVVNMTDSFNCDGDGVIALANLQNLYNLLGVKLMRDDSATCDDIHGRYLFLKLREGNTTEINEFGLSGGCYNFGIKGCEILEGTEAFMLRTLIEINKKLKQ